MKTKDNMQYRQYMASKAERFTIWLFTQTIWPRLIKTLFVGLLYGWDYKLSSISILPFFLLIKNHYRILTGHMTTVYSFSLPCSQVPKPWPKSHEKKKSYMFNLHFTSLERKLSELTSSLHLLPTNLEKTKYWEARIDSVSVDNS